VIRGKETKHEFIYEEHVGSACYITHPSEFLVGKIFLFDNAYWEISK
jgi:hypothetical protein